MKTYSDRTAAPPSRANAEPSSYGQSSDHSGGASLQPPPTFAAGTVMQRQAADTTDNITLAEAKKRILKATKGLGTDEAAIYNAIRKCPEHRRLMYDGAVIAALNGDMEGHDLWKSYLLMEYRTESNFPLPILQLWNATKGAGTNEAQVFAALESMDRRAKKSFGLKYILRCELSGDDLQRALDLITTDDTIQGNTYGGSQMPGEEDLVVNEDNLRQLIDSQFTGAGSVGLKSAMMILYGKPGGTVLTDTLKRVESIRGLASGSALGQYKKAMQKQLAGIEYYKNHKEEAGLIYDPIADNPSPPLDTGRHEGFTASNAQLRFGKVVGDVFGIDAVFGSLISPTGGMAGAGNERISHIDDGSAVATHGAVHDAAGYLFNCHGIGAGYDYLQNEPGADPANPLAGQTNIEWWVEEYDRTGRDVGFVERVLNGSTHIGAAFSKKYGELNTEQKKDALRIMSSTPGFLLSQADIFETDRINKITELMNSCNNAEKTVLADYFYNHNCFRASGEVIAIIEPYVSEDVQQRYYRRLGRQYSGGRF